MNRRINKSIEQKKGAHIFKNLELKEKTNISKNSNNQINFIVQKLQKNIKQFSNTPNQNDKTSSFSNNVYTYNIYHKENDINQQNKTLTQQNKTQSQQNKTQSQQNKTLTQQNKTQSQQNKTLTQQNKTLTQQNKTLTQQNKTPTQQNKTLTQQNKTQNQQNKTLTQQNINTISSDTLKSIIKQNDKLTNVSNKYTLKTKNLLNEKNITNEDTYISSVNMINKYNKTDKNEINQHNLEKKKKIINYPVETLGNNNDKNSFETMRQKGNDDKCPTHSTVNYKIEKKILKENIFNKNLSSIMKEKATKIKTNMINNPKNETEEIKTSIYKKIVINNNIMKTKQECNSLIIDKKKNDSQNNKNLKKFKRIIPYELPPTKKNKNENIQTCKNVAYPISSNNIYNNKENTKKINDVNEKKINDVNGKKINDINEKMNSLSIPMNFNSIENASVKNDQLSNNIDSKSDSVNYNQLSYTQKTTIQSKTPSIMYIKNGQKNLNKLNISEKRETKSTSYYPRNEIKPLLIKNKNSKNTDQIEKKNIRKITSTKSYISLTNIKMKNNSNITINNSSEKNHFNKHTNQETILKIDNSELLNKKTNMLFPKTLKTFKEVNIHHKINLNNSKDNNLFSLQYENDNIIEGNNEFYDLPNQDLYSKETTKNENIRNFDHLDHLAQLGNLGNFDHLDNFDHLNNFDHLDNFGNLNNFDHLNILNDRKFVNYNMPQMKQSYNNIKSEMDSKNRNVQNNLGNCYNDNKYSEKFNNSENSNYNNNTIVESSGTCQDGDKILITVKPMDSTDSIITSNIENDRVNCQNYILKKNFNSESKEYNLFQTNKMNNTMLKPRHESIQIGLKLDEMKRRSFEIFNYNTQVENNLSKNNKDMLSNIIVKTDNTKKQKSRNIIELIQNEDKLEFLKKRKLSYNIDTNKNNEKKTSLFFKNSINPKPGIPFNSSIRNIIEKVVGKHLVLRKSIPNYKKPNKKENTIKLNDQQVNNKNNKNNNNDNNNITVKNINNRLKKKNSFNPLNHINLNKPPFVRTQYSHISSNPNTENELSQNLENKANISMNILLKKFPPPKFEMSPNMNNISNIPNNNDKNETQNNYINNNIMSKNLKKNNIIFNSQIKSYYKTDLSQISNFSKNRQSQNIKYGNDGNKKEINNVDNNKKSSQLNYGYKKLEQLSSILLETHKDENKINLMDPADKYNNIINKFINNGDLKYDNTHNNSFGNIDNIWNFSKYSQINKKTFLLSECEENKPTHCTMTCTEDPLICHKCEKNGGKQNGGEKNGGKQNGGEKNGGKQNGGKQNGGEKNESDILQNNYQDQINCDKNPKQNVEDKTFNLFAMLTEKECKDKKIENIKITEKECKDKKIENIKMDNDNKIDEAKQLENEQIVKQNCETSKKKNKIISQKKENLESKFYRMKSEENEKTIHDDTYPISGSQPNTNDIHSKKYINNKIDCSDLSHKEDLISGKKISGKKISEKINSEKINSEKINSEKNNTEKKNSEKKNSEKKNSEKKNSEKKASEKKASEKKASEKKASENEKNVDGQREDKQRKNLGSNSFQIVNNQIIEQNKMESTNNIDEQIEIVKKNNPLLSIKPNKSQNSNLTNFDDNKWETKTIVPPDHVLNNKSKSESKNKNTNNNNDDGDDDDDNYKYITTSTQSESQNNITKFPNEDTIFNNTCLDNYDTKIKMIDHKNKYLDNTNHLELFSNPPHLNFIWNGEKINDTKDKDSQRVGEYTHAISHENCQNRQNCQNSQNSQNCQNSQNSTIFQNKKHTEPIASQSKDELNDDIFKNRKKKKRGKYIISSNDNLDISLNNNDFDENGQNEEEYIYTNVNNNNYLFNSFIYDENINNDELGSFINCEENCFDINKENKKIYNDNNLPIQFSSSYNFKTTNNNLSLFTPINEENIYHENILYDQEKDLTHLFTFNVQLDSIQEKENIEKDNSQIESKIDHNIYQEQTEISDNDKTNMIYRKLKNVFFNKINKYVKNDSTKNTSTYIESDNTPFEHTIEDVKRKKINQSTTSNKKSKSSIIRKKVRPNYEEDTNINIYEKHYINRRRKKNESENNTNSQKETSDIYTNDIIDIKIKKNEIPENSETTKIDTEIGTQLNNLDHISIIPNNQDSDNFLLSTSKIVSLYDQVDSHDSNCTESILCHGTPENYATNSRNENMDEQIENKLIIEKKEVHTKYLEIEEYTNYTKGIFDNAFFTNIDSHSDQKSMHENNIIKKDSIDVAFKDNDINDTSEKVSIHEKNITEMDTKTNLLLDKIGDDKIGDDKIGDDKIGDNEIGDNEIGDNGEGNELSDSLIKNRIEAEKLNNEIPYITNIYKEMHRSSVMPLRIEAFHSLEDQRLIYGNPDWQKYFCPLCDQKYYPPNVYVKNYIHYLNEHWNNRKSLGGYIIFPCKLEHDNNEQNPSEKKVDAGVTSYNASKKWKKKKKKMKRNARLFINPHYHCPLCLHLQFDDYQLLVEHCTKLHKSTGADPTRTLPPNFMHTPFINNNDYYCSIKKNETDISSNDILESDQSDNKIVSESQKKGDPLFHDSPSQSNLTLELNNLKKNKMKNGRISKVAFCEEIKVREYDIELSKIEKFGASIGPVFNDDKEEPSNVVASEDSVNHPPLSSESNKSNESNKPNESNKSSESFESSKLIDVVKPLDPLPILEKSPSENHSNDSVENSVCNKKGRENKIKEYAIPQNNNQTDSTNLEKCLKLDTKTKNDDKIDIDVYDNCLTSTILNNNNESRTYKKNNEISKNVEHTGYANNTKSKSIHLENSDNDDDNDDDNGDDNGDDDDNCLFRDNSKIKFLDKNESNNYIDEYVLNSTTDESTNEIDDQQYPNKNDDNINPFHQKNKNKQNLTNNISDNSLSNLLSLNYIYDSKINDIIPDSKDEYEKILQIKEQHLNEILLENIKENQKEHIFNHNDNKKVGQFIKKRINNIHKNIISKYKRKIKMSTIQDPKQREIKEKNSYLKNKSYENIYIPPKNMNITLNNEIENTPLKKIIRPKKKEKITTQQINCRKSSRNKNKVTQ
ncbi:conserved Plasmodium protein, unknown function [Plasmodium yoelii]|uniref:Uncharacterized protein n=2 Tax=Plasmodium yoelii TaxID=5861 RepID=A0A077Y5T1_PLAYE|nr:conserved Plasmodium protein, unknown function [Plasmodium yoelii]